MLTNIPTVYVGATEGARLLGISRSGFLKFVSNGRLPRPARLGRRALWDVSELVTALRKQNHVSGDRR